MAEGYVTRKLTAILYADVAGYSRLTGEDEVGTHEQLSAGLDVISNGIEAAGGRVVHYAGDAVLAEFGSIVTAVQTAVDIQRRMARRGADIPVDKRLQFRIGINLGEVIVDRDEIYGDGVNVAARLESLADPGGVCVSGTVFEQVDGKLDCAFSSMGAKKVKNIAHPVEVHKVLVQSPPAVPPSAPSPRPSSKDDTPSITVLSFEQIGETDEGFGAGLVEAIATALSRRTGITLIHNDLTRGPGATPERLTEVRADYALTGSIHRMGRRVRVVARLVWVPTGQQIWAERYDREFEDPFAVQDELLRLIVSSIRWTTSAHGGSRNTAMFEETASISDRLSRAAKQFYTPTLESYLAAGDLLDTVLDEEPSHPMALSMRAFSLLGGASFQVEPLSPAEQTRALIMAEHALEQNEGSDFGHWIRGTLLLNLERDHAGALAHANRALEINEHYAPAHRLSGEALGFGDDAESGARMLEDLLTTDSRSPSNAIVLWDLALVRFVTGDWYNALRNIDEALLRMRTMPDLFLARAAILAELGRIDEAGVALEALKVKFPAASLASIRRPPFKNEALVDVYLRALHRAGLSE